MNSLILKSPAKVNLFLEVLKKRQDGFHQIETIFHTISLFDSIHIKKIRKNGICLRNTSRNLPSDERNLVYQAIEALKKKYDFGGVEVIIDKKIPLASGLGGGSSNAACALMGMDKLWKLGIKRRELIKVAEELGSDVPFFVSGYKSAFGKGRGEILKGLKLPRYWFLLLFPDFGTSSKEAYQGLRLNLTRKTKNAKMLIRALVKKDVSQIAKKLYNRLEESTLSKFSVVNEMKKALRTAGCNAVLMSGSGPAVFALNLTKKEAMAARKHLRFSGWRMEVVRSL